RCEPCNSCPPFEMGFGCRTRRRSVTRPCQPPPAMVLSVVSCILQEERRALHSVRDQFSCRYVALLADSCAPAPCLPEFYKSAAPAPNPAALRACAADVRRPSLESAPHQGC